MSARKKPVTLMNVLQIPKRTLLAAVAVSSFENEDIIQEKIFIDFKI